MFSDRYPVLNVERAMQERPGRNRIYYAQAWVCRNGGCDYRKVVGDAGE